MYPNPTAEVRLAGLENWAARRGSVGKSCGKPPCTFVPGCGPVFTSGPQPQPEQWSRSLAQRQPLLLLPGRTFLAAPSAARLLARQQEQTEAASPAGLCGPAQGPRPLVGPDSRAMSRHKVPPAYKKWPQYLRLQKIPLHRQHEAFYFQVKPNCQYTPGTGTHLTELLSSAQV